jgi:hypothetical protein
VCAGVDNCGIFGPKDDPAEPVQSQFCYRHAA